MRHPRLSLRRRQNVLMEAVEKRVFLDANYFALAGGQFNQDWSNNGLITTNDNWDGVPSIIGYRGDAMTGATAVDPQTVLAEGGLVIDVNANQTTPNSFTTGGVTEFHLTNSTIALTGSGTARAPHIVIHLDTQGVSNIPVSFTLRDLETGTDNAVQPIAVQYRVVGEMTNYVNIPEAFVADATAGPSIAGPDIPVSFTLPGAAEGKAQVQLRILTTDAIGGDEWVGIDDIVIGSATTVSFLPATYSVFENVSGGQVEIKVKRTGDLSAGSTVDYTTSPGTAVPGTNPGEDYTTTSGTLTFDPDDDEESIFITINNDGVAEPKQSFTVTLSDAVDAQIGANDAATITIIDDDTSAPTGVVVNELKVDPPGADNPYEYIELRGAGGGETLYNTYMVSIEGDVSSTPGVVTGVIDLSNYAISSNGYLLMRSASGHVPESPAGDDTTIVNDALFDVSGGGLQNGANSFLLIYSITPINFGTDYDADNDGTLELPSGAEVVDGVGWEAGNAGDRVYASANLPRLSVTTRMATRKLTDLTANSASAWYYGTFPTGATNDSVTYDTLVISPNTPSGAVLTPGVANFDGPVSAGQFNFAISNYGVQEDVGTVTITVNRLGGGAGQVTVKYETLLTGSATVVDDYAAASGTLTFEDGETTKTFDVTIVDDPDIEGAETIDLRLFDPTGGATLGAQSTTVITIAASDVPLPFVRVNEVSVNPPGDDGPWEYIEIKGDTGGSLTNVYVISVEGDTGSNPGTADRIFDLNGYNLGSNGLLIIKAPDGSGHALGDANTTLYEFSGFTTTAGILQNGSNSFMIVFSETSIPIGTDLDGNNDGTIDYPNITVLDSVGWLDGGAGDFAYGAVLTQANLPLHAATRFPGTSTAFAASEWYGGLLSGTSDTTAYNANATSRTANFPVDGVLTPGAANVGTPDTTAPTVTGITFDFNTPGVQPSITVAFDEAIDAASVAVSDFTLVDRNSLANLSSSIASAVVTGSTIKLTFNGTFGVPPDGNLQLQVGTTIKDLAGNDANASSPFNFSFLQGDITGDGSVNTLDFNVLAGNFGLGGQSFSQGNIDFAGTIDSTDFTAFVGQYGKKLLPAPAAPLSGVALGGAGLFSDGDDLSALLDVIG